MASPITWQNINGASLAEASRPLELAQRGFNTSFDQLGAVLAQREAIDAQNQIVQRGNNTQDFQDKLFATWKTPEALAAAMQSGEVDKLRAGYGTNIDRAATRGAADALLAQRYAQTGAANEYTDKQLDRTQAPIKDQIGSLIATGRTTEAKQLLEANQLRGEASLYGALDNRGQEEIMRNRSTQDFANKGIKFQDDLLTSKVQRESAAQSIAASKENIQLSREQRATSKAVRESTQAAAQSAAQAAALRNSLGEQNNLYADGVYSGRNADSLSELMNKSGVGDNNTDRANILKRFAKGEIEIEIDGKKVNVPIPNTALKAAILSSKDQVFSGWNKGWANDVEDNLKEVLQQTYKTTDADGKPVNASKAVNDFAAFSQAIRGVQENPQIKPTKKVKNPLN